MTEIKKTLFSFVTMRAPELSDEKSKETRFVFRKAKVVGYFDTAVSSRPEGQNKWQALQLASQNFGSVSFTSEDAVKELDPILYDFAISLARNRFKWNGKIVQKHVEEQGVKIIDEDGYKKLWDNLFYQVVTQKDFYIKEILIQVLIAHNLVLFFETNHYVSDELLQAKVVLPESLFLDNTNNTTSLARKSNESGVSNCYPDMHMSTLQTLTLSTLKQATYKKLQRELKSAERKYINEYEIEYLKQKNAYDLGNKKILEDYNNEVETKKQSFCAIRDPKIPYDPNNPCDQPGYVPQPELPPFNFIFREEMDQDFLQKNLSKDSYVALQDLNWKISPDFDSTFMRNSNDVTLQVSTFAEANQLVTEALQEQQTLIANSTTVNTPNYVSYGGILVPVVSRIASDFRFMFCYKKTGNISVNFDLSFDVPDNSWQVTHFACTITDINSTDNTGSSSNVFPITATDQKITITNIFNNGISSETFRDIARIAGTITFANGCVKKFVIENSFSTSCFTGTLEGDCEKNYVGTIGITPEENPYIPSGHGFKQLGIADYKIVEQSVHCYIEGEVAHIENVMAREHRSKSTRKLTKTEQTDSVKSEQENEKITDTSTTSRFELQSEVANVIQESKDFNASTQFHADLGKVDLTANVGLATHNSREQNTRQAITNAKEIVQKATERLTKKITEERIRKITEEFEETNIHEFDNRKGDKHVVGVYRWVDKIYKNQIINYGKRLMFEFMIPEPANFHNLGMSNDSITTIPATMLSEPVDPRTYDKQNMDALTSLNLSDYSKVNERTLQKWAGVYAIEGIEKLPEIITVGESFTILGHPSGSKLGWTESNSGNGKITIPEGYEAYEAYGIFNVSGDNDGNGHNIISLSIGNRTVTYSKRMKQYSLKLDSTITIPPTSDPTDLSSNNKPLLNYQGVVPVSFTLGNQVAGDVSASVKCRLTAEAKQKWQQDTFKAIIDAYEKAKQDYQEKLAAEKEKVVTNVDTNPGFYRQIINTVLRKNCISYLIDQTSTARRTFGKDMIINRTSFKDYEVKVDESLDDYGAFVKFIEQAFEWNIMSYHFYPFYWTKRTEWQKQYQYNGTDDPLFRSFMQSGMARAIVTVRPGFEEAVQFYMQTGKIWNGGEVPVIEDKLFLSLVDELREPTGRPEGKAWATRVPTSLTILQANSIGLEVKKALPCNCEDVNSETFENPEMLPCNDSFTLNTAQIGGTTGMAKLFGSITGPGNREAKVVLKTLEGLVQDFTTTNDKGEWELKNIPSGTYNLLLDTNDAYPEDQFSVSVGEKEQTIQLSGEQGLEVNLVFIKNTI